MVLAEDQSEQWIPLADHLGIQGVLAKFDNEVRVYPVVISSIPDEYIGIHDYWPRLVPLPNKGTKIYSSRT